MGSASSLPDPAELMDAVETKFRQDAIYKRVLLRRLNSLMTRHANLSQTRAVLYIAGLATGFVDNPDLPPRRAYALTTGRR